MRSSPPRARRSPRNELGAKRLDALAEHQSLPSEQRAILRAAAAELSAAEARQAALPKINDEIAEVTDELQRLRGYLAAAKQGSDQAEPFVKRILAAEDRLRSLRARVEQVELDQKRRRTAAAALSRLARPQGAR